MRLPQDQDCRPPGLQPGCGRPESPRHWPGGCGCESPYSGTADARLQSSMHKQLGRNVLCELMHGVVLETMEQCLHAYMSHVLHMLSCMQYRYKEEGDEIPFRKPCHLCVKRQKAAGTHGCHILQQWCASPGC